MQARCEATKLMPTGVGPKVHTSWSPQRDTDRGPAGTQQEPSRNPSGTQQEPGRSPAKTQQEPSRNPTGTQQKATSADSMFVAMQKTQQEPCGSPARKQQEPSKNPTGTQQEPGRSRARSQQVPRRSPTGTQQEPGRSPARTQQEPRRNPAGGCKTVHIYTFGLEKLDADLADLCRDDGGGGKAIIQKSDLRQALLRHRAVPRMDVISDTRNFSDPEQCMGTHIGMHPKILNRIAHNRNFPGWLETVQHDIQKVLSQHPDAHVALYCRSGKHRSVACAWLLRQCVESQGWSAKTQHLSSRLWDRCCKGLSCIWCSHSDDDENQQKELASLRQHALWWWGKNNKSLLLSAS